MKTDVLTYGRFFGTVHYSADDNVFFGKIEGIADLVTFEGTTVAELHDAFREAVEDYLMLCERAGRDPMRSFKGSFNVRIDPELHEQAYRRAIERGISLNQLVQTALEHEVHEPDAEYGPE